MAAVRSAFPEAFEAMRLSANEVRGFLKSTGRSRTDFQAQGYETLDQIPVISIGRPEFMKALRAFATKLFCALHYKRTGRIVPLEGEIITRFFSNVQVMDGNLPADIWRVLGCAPVLTRANIDLRSQFDYEYQIATDRQFSVFLCAFRHSFAMVGFVSEKNDLPEEFQEVLTEGKFRSKPFQHDADRS